MKFINKDIAVNTSNVNEIKEKLNLMLTRIKMMEELCNPYLEDEEVLNILDECFVFDNFEIMKEIITEGEDKPLWHYYSNLLTNIFLANGTKMQRISLKVYSKKPLNPDKIYSYKELKRLLEQNKIVIMKVKEQEYDNDSGKLNIVHENNLFVDAIIENLSFTNLGVYQELLLPILRSEVIHEELIREHILDLINQVKRDLEQQQRNLFLGYLSHDEIDYANVFEEEGYFLDLSIINMNRILRKNNKL